MLRNLKEPDAQHLEAAQGWIELGNGLEATAELSKITRSQRTHPEVLKVLWEIQAKAGRWEKCAEIAEKIAGLVPNRVEGWLLLAESLHHLGQIEEAFDTLESISDEFDDVAEVHYRLACYATQLGVLEEALGWLRRALELEDNDRMRLRALKEPQLQPLWAMVKEMGPS